MVGVFRVGYDGFAVWGLGRNADGRPAPDAAPHRTVERPHIRPDLPVVFDELDSATGRAPPLVIARKVSQVFLGEDGEFAAAACAPALKAGQNFPFIVAVRDRLRGPVVFTVEDTGLVLDGWRLGDGEFACSIAYGFAGVAQPSQVEPFAARAVGGRIGSAGRVRGRGRRRRSTASTAVEAVPSGAGRGGRGGRRRCNRSSPGRSLRCL